MRAMVIVILAGLCLALASAAQPPQPPPGATAPQAGRPAPRPAGGPPAAYPQRPPADPAVVERGKALYGVNCTFCHGAEARGGSGGPSLIRSAIVLNDKDGELLTPLVQKGIPDRGMPGLPLTAEQVSGIAAFIHSFRVGGYDISRQRPPSIVVGDAKAGEACFNAKCGSCHSVAGDLKGFGAKFSDPQTLQQTWLMPGGGRRGFGDTPPPTTVTPVTVTVTLPSGQKLEGRLVRIDDFIVTLADSEGGQRTFRRNGDTPKVEIRDPRQPHRDLLGTYTDKDIHNVTAYLVNVK